MHYISQEKINKYIDEFNKNSNKNGFLLFIEFINFNIVNLLYGHERVELIINKFFFHLKQECDEIKNHEIIILSFSTWIVILPNSDSKFLIHISSEINKYLNLEISNDTQVNLNCKIISIEYPKYSIDPKRLLTKLFLCGSYNSYNYYTEYKNEVNAIDQIPSELERFALLKKSIIEKTTIFAYQPIISCLDGNVEYFECLIRIPDKNGEYISAGPIIPIAEKLGFINIIDQYVLRKAIEELKNSNIRLSINISNIGICDPEFLEIIKKLIDKKELAQRLIIEITETSIIHDYEKISNSIKLIHNLGCKIALDDFGSGHTSFFQLMNLPVDIMKIDGSYIKNIEKNTRNKEIIEALVRIANIIGAKTVAEFVENQEIAKLLTDLNIDYLQGNYFSPAIHKFKVSQISN